ncbi:hypothetical protein H696_01370 [Fonticula alba]|uniref:protein-tyrosine-phosphatase n=1 Tax=Fonticula alba TaxID=691883 RepID=A0A058ZDF3_FONAL|nr:hypothetical protein H696_01370 [Fonticula alba]KCV71961.1 hypothetical protein H696_01370 [Fonticula alba]|eukprot:XP_009493539.1 hypothetical protein H696_01370 [Fonticula alba]
MFFKVTDTLFIGDYIASQQRARLDRHAIRQIVYLGEIAEVADRRRPDGSLPELDAVTNLKDIRVTAVEIPPISQTCEWSDDAAALDSQSAGPYLVPFATQVLDLLRPVDQEPGALADATLLCCDLSLSVAAFFAAAALYRDLAEAPADEVAAILEDHAPAPAEDGTPIDILPGLVAFLAEKEPRALLPGELVAQLRNFRDMGFKLDMNNPVYRRRRLYDIAALRQDFNFVAAEPIYGQDPQATRAVSNQKLLLRCRQCRRPLADADHILPHEPLTGGTGADAGAGAGDSSAPGRLLRKGLASHRSYRADYSHSVMVSHQGDLAASATPVTHAGPESPLARALRPFGGSLCSSFFVEPMEWMLDVTGDPSAMQGKIACPNAKCQTKLGGFSWIGHQCPCGDWVAPAFMLNRSKVDCVLPTQSLGALTSQLRISRQPVPRPGPAQ